MLKGVVASKNCNLTQVKIDEVLCLVCYIAAKVSANNAVPSWVVFLVKFLKKQKRGVKAKKAHMKIVLSANSLLVLILLHVLGHVRILDDSLSVRHGEPKAWEACQR
uniref:Uncharacterized protein n=1 Tax=Anser cygnoides TaxID=8845 RepID=A0A8B9E7J4_ANSCY